MIDSRVKRFVVGLILFIALACLGAVAALFVWVNEKAVQKTVEEFADTALGAYARFDGPIGLKRLSTLEIELPAIKFIDKSTDVEIGRIAGARADVSLWSLALGAVHVKSLSIDGLEGALSVPNLSGNALFDSTFGAVHFPADLRISTFKLSRACLTVDVTTHEKPHRFLLTDLELSLGRFSPEMTSPFELSTRFEAIDAEGNVVSLPQDEPLPVAAPAELPSANSADVSVDLFARHHIYTKEEVVSRMEILLDEYRKTIHIEAGTLAEMLRRQVIPASIRFSGEVADSVASKASLGLESRAEKELVGKINDLTGRLIDETDKLEKLAKEEDDDVYKASRKAADVLIPQMDSCRALADSLETLVAKDAWPMPTYSDILFY